MPDDKSHAATPLASTPSELESELSAGVPSSLAKHAHTSHPRVVLAACKLQDLLRSVSRDAAESVLLGHITTFIITDTSTGPKRVTPSPETVGERLKRIYPEHYVIIITEMNRINGSERTARWLGQQAIDGQLRRCFIWERSQQGYDFWANLAKREGS